MGYSQFVQRMEADTSFSRWFSDLDADLQELAHNAQAGVRAVLVQRALIDLIDFFDRERVRFPDPNERGKVPLPTGYRDRKRLRPVSEVAHFRFDADPMPVVDAWAEKRGLSVRNADAGVRIELPSRLLRPRHEVVVSHSPPWVELHIAAYDRPPDNRPTEGSTGLASTLTARETDALDELLRRFDRPTCSPSGRRRSPSR
jgi:hypothetical protein